MINANSYRTIASVAEGQYKDKGSKFLAFAYPVESEEAIQEHLNNIKSQYHDARHHCYAYALGPQRNRYRYYDDGEPSGTAGKPIYGQILSFDVTDVLIVVVRYFGGTLLGTGGLIQAYKNAAANALQNAQIIEKVLGEKIFIRFDYSMQNRIKHLLKTYHVEIISQTFDMQCEIECKIGLQHYNEFINQLNQLDKVIIRN